MKPETKKKIILYKKTFKSARKKTKNRTLIEWMNKIFIHNLNIRNTYLDLRKKCNIFFYPSGTSLRDNTDKHTGRGSSLGAAETDVSEGREVAVYRRTPFSRPFLLESKSRTCQSQFDTELCF